MVALPGSWIVTVTGLNAGWMQAVRISNSNGANGIYQAAAGQEIGRFRGDNLEVTPMHLDPAVGRWAESLAEAKAEWDDLVGLVVTIFADDNPPNGDLDFDDLVIRCVPLDVELTSPNAGGQRLDLTIPENQVIFGR